ncbi:MAG: putative antitoxin VapB29 [Chloroflexota bacterium]
MRTTIDLPEDLHRRARAIARDTGRTLSEIVADLMRRGLAPGGEPEITVDALTGLPVIDLGQVVTTEDVRRLEEEEDEGRWRFSSTPTS